MPKTTFVCVHFKIGPVLTCGKTHHDIREAALCELERQLRFPHGDERAWVCAHLGRVVDGKVEVDMGSRLAVEQLLNEIWWRLGVDCGDGGIDEEYFEGLRYERDLLRAELGVRSLETPTIPKAMPSRRPSRSSRRAAA